jgi:hypothetical protein
MFVAGKLRIRTASMLRIHGYADPDRVPGKIRDLAASIAARAELVCEPTAWYRELGIRSCGDAILTLDNGIVLRCRDFRRLAGCRSVITFVLTLGDAVDAEVQERSKAGIFIEALFLETAAWLAIEAATRALARFLGEGVARRGLRLTRRFAPGYADWALSEQIQLFSTFGEARLPVRLLESGIMVPKMSRSGMYGLHPS